MDQDIFALGLEGLVEVGLAVELGVSGHVGGSFGMNMCEKVCMCCSPNSAMKTKEQEGKKKLES